MKFTGNKLLNKIKLIFLLILAYDRLWCISILWVRFGIDRAKYVPIYISVLFVIMCFITLYNPLDFLKYKSLYKFCNSNMRYISHIKISSNVAIMIIMFGWINIIWGAALFIINESTYLDNVLTLISWFHFMYMIWVTYSETKIQHSSQIAAEQIIANLVHEQCHSDDAIEAIYDIAKVLVSSNYPRHILLIELVGMEGVYL